jgi:hypothetical protein
MQKFAIKTALALAIFSLTACEAPQTTAVTVYKSPTCGCCSKWIEHLEANGFAVTAIDTSDVQSIKATNGVPAELASCHTALVDGYVVEGHVPAEDIHRMLTERPDVTGLAAPGMPIGSPGMEGAHPEPYEVISFNAEGETRTFSSHQP